MAERMRQLETVGANGTRGAVLFAAQPRHSGHGIVGRKVRAVSPFPVHDLVHHGQPIMQALASVSGRGSCQMKPSRLGIFTWGSVVRSITAVFGTMPFR